MVFSAISRVSSFEVDDDTLIVDTDHSVCAGREKNCMLCCGTLIIWILNEGETYSKSDLSKQKWNSVSLISCSQHSDFGTCPSEEEGGGAGSESLYCIQGLHGL